LTQITITESGESREPEISDDGSGIVQITNSDENSGTEEYSKNLPTPRAVDISGDGNYVLFESNADLTGRGELEFHSLFWATADGADIEQQLRPATIAEGVDQEVNRSYLMSRQ